MDYKSTLNLPKTAFAMKADLVAREPQRLAKWENEKLYEQIQAQRAGAERFILHDGPPFANGDVHIGNALNKILKDIVVRWQSLRGKSAPYVPGWDCHGLPIEFKVSQEMRKAGDIRSDAASIRRACEAYARKFVDIQRTQFKRLGILGDWDNPYLTLDKKYEAEELCLFADLVDKGYVYRGKKPIYWSIPCRTALAEAEVEYADHVSQSIYVKCPVVGAQNTFVLIWTTPPWTLPANLAIGYNSTFDYTEVMVGGEVYLLSVALLPEVREKCGWSDYEIIRTVRGDQLEQIEYQHPFINRTGRVYAGDHFVENSTGTGFVHIAPGHGLEDYGLGMQRGLPIYSPVDDDGRFAYTTDLPREQQMDGALIGKSILEKNGSSDANEAVLHQLRERNRLLHQEEYHHSYPFCWRSKTPVIFRGMDQWFIRIDHNGFRELALQAIDQVTWIPDWGKARIQAAVKSRPDWCISRQRTWGVPIPAFYSPDGQPILDSEIVRKTAALVGENGTNIWFETSAEDLWKAVRPPSWMGPEASAKSTDTLDVWIDSGSSSRAVLMQRPEYKSTDSTAGPGPKQADMYLEGSDQHRGWFQSSLLLSLAANGIPPYRSVFTHGFMVDADREKISKSKQTGYEKPQTSEAYIKKYGADVVRLWVGSQDCRNDIIVSEERIGKVGETYRLLRNTLRYQLSNLYDFDPEVHLVPDEKLTSLDRWILASFAALERDVAAAYERFEFHFVYQRISQFCAVELSAIYHDVVKDRLYTDPANSLRRRSTQMALYRMVRSLCQMLSPMLTFTSDEAWEHLPGSMSGQSVHLGVWQPQPVAQTEPEAAAWRDLLEVRERVLPIIEQKRQAGVVGKALEAVVTVCLPGRFEPIVAHKEDLRELLNVSQLNAQLHPGTEIEITAEHVDPSFQKCERCWHWETDIGVRPEHPTLCPRCTLAVTERGCVADQPQQADIAYRGE